MAKRRSKSKKVASSSSSASSKTISKLSISVKEKRTKSNRNSKRKNFKIDAKIPKKPATPFSSSCMEDFRKDYQEQNPDIKSMRDIGKACGEKWNTMTYEEKVKYYDIATVKRAEFDQAMTEYIKKKESGGYEETDDDSDYDE